MIGIYRIVNNITGESYVGQSEDIEKRFSLHRSRVNNLRYNNKLYTNIRNYGIENFEFIVLRRCSKSMLNAYEDFFIKYYNCIEEGYNEVCTINKGRKITKTLLRQIIVALRKNDLSMEKIANQLGISYSTVNQINRGKMFYNSELTYPIRETSRTKRG